MSMPAWLLTLVTLLVAYGISYLVREALRASNASKAASAEGNSVPTQASVLQEEKKEPEVKVDRRLPPLKSQCLACGKEAKEVGKALLRCSQCKNAFYCNEECQKREWKRHKYNCSLFPPEGIKSAAIPVTKDLVDEVRRVDLMLKAWMDKLSELTGEVKENVEKVNGADLPEAWPICQLKLSPKFEYNRLPQQQLERHPFRSPLIQIARLYLIALVASHPNPEHRSLLAEKIDSVTLPSHLAALYGPKVVNRPGELSPGEYDTFAEIAPAVMVEPEKVGMDESERGRWIALAVGLKKLWNATLVPRPPSEKSS